MPEFTGERLIPGEADPDLWNEHFSRYLFAARLARSKRVVELGCGAGYGAAELALHAESVVAIDLSVETLELAARKYAAPNLKFLAADCAATPLKAASFDLVVSFEVIEHMRRPEAMLEEAKRLLKPSGQFVISTPNRMYYAESRGETGPNPFHEREFDFEEFRSLLSEYFPSVVLFTQNHAASIVFQPVAKGHAAADLHMEEGEAAPGDSHFFLAVCATRAQTGAPTYVYLPTAANVLREREQHIGKLDGEMRQKDEWLDKLKAEHAALVEMYREQTNELRACQKWGQEIEAEYEQYKTVATGHISGYEAKIASLESEITERSAAAQAQIDRLESELTAKLDELFKCVEILHGVEASLEEQKRWAKSLEARKERLEAMLRALRSSRWLKMGRRMGVGPDLTGY